MTLRDTFAAAALTGLLAQGDDGSFSEEPYVRAAYRWADAMLREREQTKEKDASFSCTNHDAAPAATARTDADRDRTDKAPTRPGEGTGDTFSPIAKRDTDSPQAVASAPQPHTTPGEGTRQERCTLTAEEREAIHRAEARLRTAYVPDDETAATLRELLERLA
jgi:hypothetical protein